MQFLAKNINWTILTRQQKDYAYGKTEKCGTVVDIYYYSIPHIQKLTDNGFCKRNFWAFKVFVRILWRTDGRPLADVVFILGGTIDSKLCSKLFITFFVTLLGAVWKSFWKPNYPFWDKKLNFPPRSPPWFQYDHFLRPCFCIACTMMSFSRGSSRNWLRVHVT